MKAHYVLGLGSVAALAVGLWIDAPSANAFPFEDSWHLAASGQAGVNRAGAEGIYGLGSPSEFGIRCDHCHNKPDTVFQVEITASPAFTTQGNDTFYTPGQAYDIRIAMLNETKLNGGFLQLNGFAASFEAADGAAMGVLVADNGRSDSCPANAPAPADGPSNRTMVYGDCHGVIYEPEPLDTFWDFQWIAPAAGAGDVTFWYGVVDGDEQAESSLGDDTVQGKIDLLEM